MTVRKLQEATTEVRVESELYIAGQDEFGSDFTAECYHVCIFFDDGSSLRHERNFYGTEDAVSPDGFSFFPDLRPFAKAAADHLADRVRAALICGTVHVARHWEEGRPAYGSPAYLDEVAMMTPEQRAN